MFKNSRIQKKIVEKNRFFLNNIFNITGFFVH